MLLCLLATAAMWEYRPRPPWLSLLNLDGGQTWLWLWFPEVYPEEGKLCLSPTVVSPSTRAGVSMFLLLMGSFKIKIPTWHPDFLHGAQKHRMPKPASELGLPPPRWNQNHCTAPWSSSDVLSSSAVFKHTEVLASNPFTMSCTLEGQKTLTRRCVYMISSIIHSLTQQTWLCSVWWRRHGLSQAPKFLAQRHSGDLAKTSPAVTGWWWNPLSETWRPSLTDGHEETS